MRTPQEIILEFRNVLYWSQPNIKHDEMLALINELEASLNPVEEPTIEEVLPPPTEEDIKKFNEALADFLEIEVTEELTEEVIEEPIVKEVVAPKKRPRKV